MAAVTFALMRPPGAARSRKLKPCSAMYVVRVAATAVNFANLISDPLTAPVAAATRNIRTKPRRMTPNDFSSLMKKLPTTTRKPTSGPTDRSMPPIISATVCPSEMKPSAAAATMSEPTLNEFRYRLFLDRMYAPRPTMTTARISAGA